MVMKRVQLTSLQRVEFCILGSFVQNFINFSHLDWLFHSISYFLQKISLFLHKMGDFAQNLSFCCLQKLQKKLQNVQHTSARLIFKKRKFDSITAELINELHWLPIKQRIDYKILALVYKALHGQAPSDVTDMLQITTRRQLRSSCSDGTTLFEPRTLCYLWWPSLFCLCT